MPKILESDLEALRKQIDTLNATIEKQGRDNKTLAEEKLAVEKQLFSVQADNRGPKVGRAREAGSVAVRPSS